MEAIFLQDSALMRYVPDNIKFQYLTREFLFAVIYEVRRGRYDEMVHINEQEENRQSGVLLAEYSIKVIEKYRTKLINLPDINEYQAKQDNRFLRKKKKGVDLVGLIKKQPISNNYRINQVLAMNRDENNQMN